MEKLCERCGTDIHELNETGRCGRCKNSPYPIGYDFNDAQTRKVYKYRTEDKKKGRDNDITMDFFQNIILVQPCVYCGAVENIGCDRLDNSKGHTQDNVVPCCGDCNRTRGDRFTFQEMLQIGALIKQIKLNRLKN